MHTTSSTLNSLSFRRWAPALAVSLLGFAGALACGSSGDPIGGNPQPITGDDDADPAAECAGGIPVSTGGEQCQVIGGGLCFTTAEAACACAGCSLDTCAIAESFPAQAFCQSDEPVSHPDEPVSDGDGEPGCGDSGGGSDPDPGSACDAGRPRSDDPEQRCDFVVEGLCFDSAAAACACNGCAEDDCIVLESYPAQIACGQHQE